MIKIQRAGPALAMVVALAMSGCESSEPSVTDSPADAARADTKAKASSPSKTGKADKRKDDREPEPELQPKQRPPAQPRPREPRRVVRYLVTEVVDGDTVKVAKAGETTIRIIGVDTPETVHPFEPVECGGPQASKTAAALLTGKRVRLVYDPSQGRLDVYDRTLAYVTVPGLGDFGLAMVRRGHAAEYTYDTAYARQSQYLQAESRAQSLDKGVWDRCGGVGTPLVAPRTAPAPAPQPKNSGSCAPGYSPCVPPYPPDLNCDDVDGPITITGDDPHGFDADGDGTGCES